MSKQIGEAIKVARAGNRRLARKILIEFLKQNPKSVDAWLLLANLVNPPEQKAACLQRVLALQPEHAVASKQLAEIEQSAFERREHHRSKPEESNMQRSRSTERPEDEATTSLTIFLDPLVDKWMDVLSFTEFSVLKLFYGLEGKSFSVGAIGRILSIDQKRRSVTNIKQNALEKLNDVQSRKTIRPFRSYLIVILKDSTKGVSVSQLKFELQQGVGFKRYDPVGVSRLVFDLEANIEWDAVTESWKVMSGSVRKESITRGTPDLISSSSQPSPTYAIDDRTSLDVLQLSRRSYNALKRWGVDTISGLVSLQRSGFQSVYGIGEKATTEIESKLQAYLSAERVEGELRSVPLDKEIENNRDFEPVSEDEFLSVQDLNLSPSILEALNGSGIVSLRQLASMTEKEILGVPGIGPTATREIDRILRLCLKANTESIKALRLSRRAFNALRRSEITTIGGLSVLSHEELLKIKNIGPKTANEIRKSLRDYLVENPPAVLENDVDPDNILSSLVSVESLENASDIPLNQISIERLGLSTNLLTHFNLHQVKTIGDLMKRTDAISTQQTIRESLTRYLRWIKAQGADTWRIEMDGEGLSPIHRQTLANRSIEDLIDEWLSILPKREQKILHWRFGLAGNGEQLTLEEVGERLNLSRERIRQLEVRSLNSLQKPKTLETLQPLIALITETFNQHSGLMTVDECREWFSHPDSIANIGDINMSGVIELLSRLSDSIHYFAKQGFVALTTVPTDEIIGVQIRITKILAENLRPLSSNAITKQLKQTRFYNNRNDILSDEFLLACLRVHPDVEEREAGLYGLTSWQNKIIDEIIMALRELTEPAHYSIIAEKTNALLPPEQQTNSRNVHAHLGRYDDVFVRVGHGIFGLAEWGLHDDGSVANAAYRVIKEAGRPLHIDVITDKVLETWYVRPNSVYMAIQNDDRFNRVGKGVYYLRELSASKESAEAKFSDLFGRQIGQWQRDFDRADKGGSIDAHSEVDKLRNIGLDFFED